MFNAKKALFKPGYATYLVQVIHSGPAIFEEHTDVHDLRSTRQERLAPRLPTRGYLMKWKNPTSPGLFHDFGLVRHKLPFAMTLK
jgi:hypothetical protein